MEEVCSRRQNTLAGLMQGRELLHQLKIELQLSNSSDKYESFVQKIVSSFDNAIALLNPIALLENGTPPSYVSGNTSGSANLTETSLKSEEQSYKAVSRKRKMTQKSNQVVRVYSKAGHQNDGYSWRKYGHKVILNSNHPRAYYRCTHLNTRRCLAKKHVQRTDDNASVFEVVYIGKHSCVHETMRQNRDNLDAGNKEEEGVRRMVSGFGYSTWPGLKVEHEELDLKGDARTNKTNSTPVESQGSENAPLFFDLSKDVGFNGGNSTPFISPETSESYFSLSQGQVNGFVVDSNLSCVSDFAETVSNATTSTFGDFDLSIERPNFDLTFLDAFDVLC